MWMNIKPMKKVLDSGREVEVLQERWTLVLIQAMWDEIQLPWEYNFRRHVVGHGECYIQIHDYCTTCT